ncbi:MAG: S-layer homology domain-containing protein [Clostridia bacterium]|nr:S-layer homology domain-containing protein [Clostridia bacterium]
MKKILSFIIALIIITPTWAFGQSETASYIYETVSLPEVGSVGGEWSVIGLARSDMTIPDEYFDGYYERVEKYVKDRSGILHERKYTEYSRVIIALTAIGRNPSDVGGYNLLMPLGDYSKTVWQGINGAVWALIALDCGDYEIPLNPNAEIQATREMYIDYILEKQLPDGGWAMQGTEPNADITGMALQALSGYRSMEKVNTAVEKALSCSRTMSYNNSEGYVQMIVAYCGLGIEPPFEIPDEYRTGRGFRHLLTDTDINLMATEQCLYALVAVERFENGKPWLYDMSDAVPVIESDTTEALPVIHPGKAFEDTASHPEKKAIEALAQRGIINGVSDTSFSPDTTMTRAEFAAITARSLGLESTQPCPFSDVLTVDWFYASVNSAYSAGIIKGVSDSEFNPYGTVTKEEAAVMVARSAKLLGINTDMEEFAVRNVLSVFSDYKTVSDWAAPALAYCCSSDIIPDDGLTLQPRTPATRAEIAHMLYNLLIQGDMINE